MFNDEAHAFVCRLRSDKTVAKRWCPDLVDKRGVSTVHTRTCADVILLSLMRRLGGELQPVRNKPPADANPTKKGAHAFKLMRRGGRPNRETAVAEAAVKLVEQRGEQRIRSEAVRRRRGNFAELRRRWHAEHKVGTFTSRGNAVMAPKAAAMVEAASS